MAVLQFPAPSTLLQPLKSEYFLEKECEVWMLRLDLLHPLISGNKWLKLSGWLPAGFDKGIITQGGPWSNHVHAAAAYCHLTGMPFKAIINAKANMITPMLEDVKAWGGELIYANRAEFADSEAWQRMAIEQQMVFIPMGGDGAPGIAGVKAYFDQLTGEQFDEVWCAVGTGTTLGGIAQSGIIAPTLVACFPGFKDPKLEQELTALESTFQRRILMKNLPDDRFNQLSDEVIDCMNKWWQMTSIPTDRIYTGKMVSLFLQHLQVHQREQLQKVLLVHTGGLQGNRSLPAGLVKFMGE